MSTDVSKIPTTFIDIIKNPLNLVIIGIIGYSVYKFIRRKLFPANECIDEPPPVLLLPPMKKRDFTVTQLQEYDGIKNERILMAVNGKVFDVTKGKRFYGQGGPYGLFAGRDASRGLAKFEVEPSLISEDYDDLSDLNTSEMDQVREWEMQFTDRYDLVGKLLRPGELAQDYSDMEEVEDATTAKKDS